MNRFEERLAPVLKDFIEKGVAGCSVQGARRAETLYEKHLGYADVETKRPVAPDTIYRIYSMSKVITCTAALMLYERGLYALNDPLSDYLPEFGGLQVYRVTPKGELSVSPAARPIRVKDLFMMTSGYPYPGEETETARRMAKELEALEKGSLPADGTPPLRAFTKTLAKIPAAFDPGTHWMYGMSHDILGAFIETLSGKSFGRFLEDEIFTPLGMRDTSFHIAHEKRGRLCSMYDRADDGTMTKNTRMDDGYQPGAPFESGGGGLLSTLDDYGRFAQALAMGGGCYGARLLSPHTLRLMATNHLNAALMADYSWSQLAGYGYGLGVRVLVDPAAGGSASNAGEFGWAGMAGTLVYIDPKEQLSAVYMQQLLPNQEPYHMPRLRDAIYGAL
jgi:CubicO group peptidase (beta-lactamase class C family)